jgi:hypothetical protein
MNTTHGFTNHTQLAEYITHTSNALTGLDNVQQKIVMYGANIITPISFEIHHFTVDVNFFLDCKQYGTHFLRPVFIVGNSSPTWVSCTQVLSFAQV